MVTACQFMVTSRQLNAERRHFIARDGGGPPNETSHFVFMNISTWFGIMLWLTFPLMVASVRGCIYLVAQLFAERDIMIAINACKTAIVKAESDYQKNVFNLQSSLIKAETLFQKATGALYRLEQH